MLDKFNGIIINFIERHFTINGNQIEDHMLKNGFETLVSVFGIDYNLAKKLFCTWASDKVQGPYIITINDVKHYYVLMKSYSSYVAANNKWKLLKRNGYY